MNSSIHVLFAIAVFFLAMPASSFSQKIQTFDIITFKAPAGWQSESAKDAVQFGIERDDGGICLISVFRSLPASSDPKANFEAAWKTIVKEVVPVSGEPDMQPSVTEQGWTSEGGFASYESDGRKGVVMLITMSGGDKMVNILVLTNTDAFQREIETFLGSIDLPAVKSQTQTASGNPPTESAARLVGKWNRSGSVSPVYADPVSMGNSGYSKNRYEFLPGGKYHFTERTFRYGYQNILVVKESGSYSVNGNQLTIRPERSVIESYTKENNTDALGKLVKSQNRELETTTYTFTFHYFSGIQEWNLVLQADRPTNRDGAFSNNTTFQNAWYFDQRFTDNDLTSRTGNE